jgi:hypothetical protein
MGNINHEVEYTPAGGIVNRSVKYRPQAARAAAVPPA